MEKCDALTVLRDGNIIVTFDKSEFDEDKIKSSMIGRQLEGDYYRSDYDGSCEDEVVLEMKDVNLTGKLIDLICNCIKEKFLESEDFRTVECIHLEKSCLEIKNRSLVK